MMNWFRPFGWGLCLALAIAPAARAADPAPALTPAQAEAVNKQIRDYLMNHPDVLMEALQHAEAAADSAKESATRQAVIDRHDELVSDPTSPVLGNPKGDVTVVEFFDYRCPYCKSVAPILQTLIEQDHKVRLVLKELPILGKASGFASHVALVAQRHGKYAEFHQAMFALRQPVTEDSTLDVARSVGLDPAMVKREMDSPEFDKIIKNNLDLAHDIGASGTPAFIVGTTLVPGAVDLKDLQGLIAAERKG